jgi:hypothetical protein
MAVKSIKNGDEAAGHGRIKNHVKLSSKLCYDKPLRFPGEVGKQSSKKSMSKDCSY